MESARDFHFMIAVSTTYVNGKQLGAYLNLVSSYKLEIRSSVVSNNKEMVSHQLRL